MSPENVQGQRLSPDQEKQLRDILSQIGPVHAMQFFSGWLSQSAQAGHYGPEYRDTIQGVVTSLNDTSSSLRGQTG